ncbi:chromate efflux transporter [Devosia sp.]|uniref:chromate efflux transporter n=1 Tax=Devosia sp. TaxID=1871048 RepID=UPI002AFFD91F|nr:chromate efflux transporter [Devosia sp.]
MGGTGTVFRAFLKLGLTAFGGPVAHLGYFRTEFVQRRGWLSEADYADLVALCQFLPGPASSQVGFAIGLWRAGWTGALAAWAGFTLPSALLLLAFALLRPVLDGPLADGVVHGLKLVAVAVVAQAVWGMAPSLAPDRQRAGIAVLAAAACLLLAGAGGQMLAIAGGGGLGLALCRTGNAPGAMQMRFNVSRTTGLLCLGGFALLLAGLPMLAALANNQALSLFDGFYRAGALVFGGGHVVLPLLDAETVARGWVDEAGFLAGYGAAQAVPGPLFTFAAYLGAIGQTPPNGAVGAAIALAAIFLPGMLLLVGVLPFWNGLRRRLWGQAALRGVNAAVVGILGAALYDPVFTSAVRGPLDLVLAVAGFVALVNWKLPPWAVVVALAGLGAILARAGL